MKKYSDVEVKRVGGGKETLPAGGYVCTILSARVESGEWGDTLVIAHDVCEGEFKDFFKRDYEGNPNEDKKWRGTFRLRLPKDDGSEYDVFKKKSLGNFIWAIENSNSGYAWAWDEKTLKGKKIGLLYRNKEWEYNGRSGWTTEAISSDSVDDIREGKFKIPKDKPLANKVVADATVFTEDVDDGELPF